MDNVSYKTGKKVCNNVNSAYNFYQLNNAKKITFTKKKKVTKVLWNREVEYSNLVLAYNNKKIIKKNIDGLAEAYKYIIDNYIELFKEEKIINIVHECNFEKAIISVEATDIEIIIDFLKALEEQNVKYFGYISNSTSKEAVEKIYKKLDFIKSTISATQIKAVKEIEIEPKDIVEIKPKEIELGSNVEESNLILFDTKKYYILIELNSSIIKQTANNPCSYSDSLEIYNSVKDNLVSYKSISLIKDENGIETVLFKKEEVEKKYTMSGYLKLHEDFIKAYESIKEADEIIRNELSVKDKQVSETLHEIENKTFETLEEHKDAIDKLKIDLNNRRDIKGAELIRNYMYNNINDMKMNEYKERLEKAKSTLDAYNEGAELYRDNQKGIVVCEYKNDEDLQLIIAFLELDKSLKRQIKINKEEKKIYVYKKC